MGFGVPEASIPISSSGGNWGNIMRLNGETHYSCSGNQTLLNKCNNSYKLPNNDLFLCLPLLCPLTPSIPQLVPWWSFPLSIDRQITGLTDALRAVWMALGRIFWKAPRPSGDHFSAWGHRQTIRPAEPTRRQTGEAGKALGWPLVPVVLRDGKTLRRAVRPR